MKRAIITGASSGIGLALAQELSRRGWSLALLARRTDLLNEAVASLGGAPPALAVTCDVTDAAAVEQAVRRAEGELGGTFGLAVANAGVAGPTHAAKFKIGVADGIVRVNVIGMMNLFAAVIPSMVERKSGRFAAVASLSGYRGLPSASVYSASKAAVQTFLEASRIELGPYGVGVTIINPGFVATPLTARNRFRMPFILTAEKAAKVIADGLERGKRVLDFPLATALSTHAIRHLPDAIYDRLLRPAGRLRTEGRPKA